VSAHPEVVRRAVQRATGGPDFAIGTGVSERYELMSLGTVSGSGPSSRHGYLTVVITRVDRPWQFAYAPAGVGLSDGAKRILEIEASGLLDSALEFIDASQDFTCEGMFLAFSNR